jgi:hypothetical protein
MGRIAPEESRQRMQIDCSQMVEQNPVVHEKGAENGNDGEAPLAKPPQKRATQQNQRGFCDNEEGWMVMDQLRHDRIRFCRTAVPNPEQSASGINRVQKENAKDDLPEPLKMERSSNPSSIFAKGFEWRPVFWPRKKRTHFTDD